MISIHENHVYPEQVNLISEIEEWASYNQEKTNVDLRKAYAKVYSAHKYHRETFQSYMEWINSLNLGFGNVLNTAQIWGMVYDASDKTMPHQHPEFEYAGIHYLEADEGCGKLYVNHEEIIPKPNMIVVCHGWDYHWVMPAENPNAKRVAMVFNFGEYHEDKWIPASN